MTDDFEPDYDPPYELWDQIDFSIVTSEFRWLPLFKDDLWLGMQAMNVGIADSVITEHEYALLREYFEIEKTPLESAMAVSALSQMWIYGLYEVLRMWRDRRFQFKKLYDNGGIDLKIANLPDDDAQNMSTDIRRKQLELYRSDASYRDSIEKTWELLEPIFRMVELFRINLAKHCAPGKDGAIPRAPGYGRINRWCGAMDYELLDKDGYYQIMNRRDIADALRRTLKEI
ncbi:hypothetical protein ACFQ4Q_14035 [Lysobacter gummosus]|uniref:hypothetical protein n=2 Tax=Lysobacter gummosus TaxID=262324 RepID=UPI00363F6B47